MCCCGCSSNSKGTCTCTCETRPVSAADRQAQASLIRTATRVNAPLEQQGAASTSAAAGTADDGGKKGDSGASETAAATSGDTAKGGADVAESPTGNELPMSDPWETRQLLDRCALSLPDTGTNRILNNSGLRGVV